MIANVNHQDKRIPGNIAANGQTAQYHGKGESEISRWSVRNRFYFCLKRNIDVRLSRMITICPSVWDLLCIGTCISNFTFKKEEKTSLFFWNKVWWWITKFSRNRYSIYKSTTCSLYTLHSHLFREIASFYFNRNFPVFEFFQNSAWPRLKSVIPYLCNKFTECMFQ